MISTAADGGAHRGGIRQSGRGRESSNGRGRGIRPSSAGTNYHDRQQGVAGQPEQLNFEDTYPPGFAKQQQQQPLHGFIVALFDSYGFIRIPEDQQQIFFHGSEVQNSSDMPDEQFDMQQLLQIGDEVSFDLKHIIHKVKKVNAVNVCKLKSGTIAALQSADRGRFRGTVKTIPGEASWRSSEVTPGVIVFTKPSAGPEALPEQQATYKNSNLKLRVGDKVEFSFALGETGDASESQATAITLLARAADAAADNGLQHGCIVAVKEGFGFIRPAGRPNRVYFRVGEVIGPSLKCVPLNAEVSYTMTPDPRGRQDMAAKIHILPNKLDVAKITACQGKLHGRVTKVAEAPPDSHLQDGLLNFTEGQTTMFCSYGALQVKAESQLQVDDEVQFSAGTSALTGAYKATHVELLMSAAERSQNREVGQIKNMKKEFGFINCCERVADMFFHHSALEGDVDQFAVGNDVSFKVVKEPNGERPNAVEIRKVAQGSAVFEVRPEEEYTGKVVARAVPPNRGYNSAGESGLVAFEEAGMKQQLPYGAADLQDGSLNPAVGDSVTFHTATNIAAAKAAEKSAAPNRQFAGKRAIQVTLVPQQGLVVSIAGVSGVLEFSQDQAYDIQSRSNKQRIPFVLPERQEAVQLKPSDLVSFVVMTDARGKDRSAHSVTIIKEGDGTLPEEPSHKNPNAMKFTGPAAEGSKPRSTQAVRIARGPDGTRGFTAALQPGNRARLLPPTPPPAAPSSTQGANGHSAQTTATQPNARPSTHGKAEPTPSQGFNRDGGSRQGGRGQPTSGTPPGRQIKPVQKRSNPSAILQPPARQQSSSPVPVYRTSSPSPPVQQPSDPMQVQQPSASIGTEPASTAANGSPQGTMHRNAQNGFASQGRRQRQQRASPGPGQSLHRQAVHARAEQAVQQQPGHADQTHLTNQPVDVSVLRAQQRNVMPSPSPVPSPVSTLDVNGLSQAAQKTTVGSQDLQRTASGKLRATAAPFVPRSASGSPLSTAST